MSNIETILKERGGRYGEFREHARIAQNIKKAMYDSPNWSKLSDDKKQALEVIADKIGRILNGDPEYADSWDDIIGYVTLVKREVGNQWKHGAPTPRAPIRLDKMTPIPKYYKGPLDDTANQTVTPLGNPTPGDLQSDETFVSPNG